MIFVTYFESDVNQDGWHNFSDALMEAICLVVCLQKVKKQENADLTLVNGKCRVAVVRNKTVAILELQTLLTVVGLRELILDEPDIGKNQYILQYFTDSGIVSNCLQLSNKM